LNLWYLGDDGLAELGQALRTGCYRIGVPEESALLVVAWLLEHEHHAAALDLVAELRPLMHRLRFTPMLSAVPSGAVVRRNAVGEVRAQLRQATVPPRIAAMRETLQVWNPLYDRLVALWCDTVDGDLPYLDDGVVHGGWPCRVWPDDWAERRRQWMDDYKTAAELNRARHPKSNFARLQTLLEQCPDDSSALSGREVGWIRRALANTISAHGAPGSETRTVLRTTQSEVVARPTYATLAHVLSARLDGFPREGGLPDLEPVAGPVDSTEAPAAAGAAMPDHLLAKAARALEAPIGELVERGVIGSGEVLAEVLPQVTAQLLAANIADPALASVYAQTYAAFRRRRSLLLLNLEHQVRFEELPWIDAVAPYRDRSEQATRAAVQTLRETTTVALGAFPQTILPNPLVREFSALTAQAGRKLPLVEEVAADIFMGTFTQKWREAAVVAGRVLAGTLYAQYYDLPDVWQPVEPPRKRLRIRWGKPVAEDFAQECGRRAVEAQTPGSGGYVAQNGTVLEQSQILTTHNLAVLIDALGLEDWLRGAGRDLADRAFGWAIRRQTQAPSYQGLKNTAYAWRQAIFYLSFCDGTAQREVLAKLEERAAVLGPRFAPAVTGLVEVAGGQRFDATGRTPGGGRRLLGWSAGPHWCLAEAQPPLVV
ncbi:MAG TPA: hypothetical protein VGL05_16165, partial [Kribbella sp.]